MARERSTPQPAPAGTGTGQELRETLGNLPPGPTGPLPPINHGGGDFTPPEAHDGPTAATAPQPAGPSKPAPTPSPAPSPGPAVPGNPRPAPARSAAAGSSEPGDGLAAAVAAADAVAGPIVDGPLWAVKVDGHVLHEIPAPDREVAIARYFAIEKILAADEVKCDRLGSMA